MGLSESIQNVVSASQTFRCGFGRLEDTVSADDWQLLTATIEQLRKTSHIKRNGYSGLTAAGLSRALRAEGHLVSAQVVQDHAYGHCRCGF